MEVWCTRACLLLALVTAGWNRGSAAGHGSPDPEDEVKAAIVFSFARFTEWPADTGQDGALVIGVLGRTDFRAALERVTEGRTVQNRTVQVRVIASPSEAVGCQIVFVGLTGRDRVRQAMATLPGRGALTIGEDPGFLEAGGAIRLFERDGRMSFDFSPEALAERSLAVSAKLLRLGQASRRGAGS